MYRLAVDAMIGFVMRNDNNNNNGNNNNDNNNRYDTCFLCVKMKSGGECIKKLAVDYLLSRQEKIQTAMEVKKARETKESVSKNTNDQGTEAIGLFT